MTTLRLGSYLILTPISTYPTRKAILDGWRSNHNFFVANHQDTKIINKEDFRKIKHNFIAVEINGFVFKTEEL